MEGKTRAPRATEPRLGPRPLPIYLAAAALTALSSRAALPLLSDGSLAWRPDFLEQAQQLRESLAGSDPTEFAAAVDRAARRRLDRFLAGILAYRRHPWRRALSDPPTAWTDGTTRLLDYAPATADGPPLLVVPSLINRGYVLDLTEEHSLLRHLAARGVRPFLVDWDLPGPVERGFTLTDYIAGRLEGALDAVLAITGRRPVVLGYCMGGLLALALADRRQEDVAALALLATPWDFLAEPSAAQAALPLSLPWLRAAVEAAGQMPTDLVQLLFFALDPLLVVRKFSRFAALDPAGPAARDFVALEDWLNDGVPLAGPVAEECLAGWYVENRPGRGTWRVAGRAVRPERIRLPALVMVPATDRIVPPAAARVLADRLPAARRLDLPLGHIGMVVSRRASALAWRPLVGWLRNAAVQ